MKAVALTVILVAVGATGSHAADNLVANGSFDTHVAYWDLHNSSANDIMDWDAEDANGSPTSGSMVITEGDGNQSLFGAQCIPVLGGNDYQFSGDMKIEHTAQSAKILLQQYQSIDCGTGFVSNLSGITIAVGLWIHVDLPAPLDPSTNSVLLGGWLDNGTLGTATAKYDSFSLSSDTVIFFDSFEYGHLLRWDYFTP